MDCVIRHFDRFDALPEAYAGLRAVLGRQGLFGDPAWFDLLLRHHFEGRDRLCLLAAEDARDGRPLLLAPMRLTRHDSAAPGALVLASIHHNENYAPAAFAIGDSVEQPVRLLEQWFRRLRQHGLPPDGEPPDLVRLMPLEAGSALGDMLLEGLRGAGWPVQAFKNSFNRYEDTAGLDHEAYFAGRSANLRYSVRRRRRALEKAGGLELSVVRDEAQLEQALLDYLQVTHASWKNPRTMADPALLAMIRLAAAHGCLRLGLLRLNGEPAATQFWMACGGVGYCVRLAYDRRFAKQAVGIVLTDHMIGQLLDVDHVERLDFGYGGEDSKTPWMGQSRVFVGMLAFNTRRWVGRWQALRHLGGRPVKHALKAVRDRLRPERAPA